MPTGVNSIDIQRTFMITDPAGNLVEGSLVESKVLPIIQEQMPLVKLGLLLMPIGGLTSFAGANTIESRRGATFKLLFATRAQWVSGIAKNMASQKYVVQKLLININQEGSVLMESNELDSIMLPNGKYNLQNQTLGALAGDGYKVIEIKFYKNLIKEALKDKTGNKFNRYNQLKLADMTADPKKLITAILKSGRKLQRKIDLITSYMGKHLQTFMVSPEVKDIIVQHAGELGRTVKYLLNTEGVEELHLDGFRIMENVTMGSTIKSGAFEKNQSLDLSNYHVIHISHRIQFAILAMLQFGKGADPKMPYVWKYDSAVHLEGMTFNKHAKDEVNFIVETLPT